MANIIKGTGAIFIGAFAGTLAATSTSMADGDNVLIAVGDYGSPSYASDGGSDQIWLTGYDGTKSAGVQFNYIDLVYGFWPIDTSGRLVDVIVNGTGGSGYGANCTSFVVGTDLLGGPTYNGICRLEYQDNYQPFSEAGWWASAVIDNAGSGGIGAEVNYRVDGPAGGVFFSAFGKKGVAGFIQQDFAITNGSTGYMPGATNATYAANNVNASNGLAVTISVSDGQLGSFGFLTDGGTAAGASGYTQVYNINGNLNSTTDSNQRDRTLFIVNDNKTSDPKQSDDYGNYRLYLGATPEAADGSKVSGHATGPGQIANLVIVVNGNATDPGSSANQNSTSGIGYEPGFFTIYDAEGNEVSGVEIAYEVDVEGRVYVGYKGAWNGQYGQSSDRYAYRSTTQPNNANQLTGGPSDAVIAANVNNAKGWYITRNNGNLTDTAGYTVVPQGDGSGFRCEAVQLYGQVINMQSMATNSSLDTTGTPIIDIAARGSASVGSWSYEISSPHTGTIIDAVVLDTGGQSYVSAPTIKTAADDTGTQGELTGIIGNNGSRQVNMNGTDLVFDAIAPGYECFPNGDFNGDGFADLVWFSEDYGCYIWNMGINAEIIHTAELPAPGADWRLVGLGGFDSYAVGCGMLWHNDATGQSAAWWVDSSSSNTAELVVDSAYFETLSYEWEAVCTNNAAMNAGNALYWWNSFSGEFAYWPIRVTNGGTKPVLGEGAGYIQASGENLALLPSSGWLLQGVANMAGRPVNPLFNSTFDYIFDEIIQWERIQSNSVQRDMIFRNVLTGETAIWVLGSNHIELDASFPGNGGQPGAYYIQDNSSVVLGFPYVLDTISWVGVGLYVYWTAYTEFDVTTPGNGFRLQQFPTLNWAGDVNVPSPGGIGKATVGEVWKMDRNVSVVDYSEPPANRGTGLSAQPNIVTVKKVFTGN